MLICGAVLFLLVQSFAFADDEAKPKGPKVTDKVSVFAGEASAGNFWAGLKFDPI